MAEEAFVPGSSEPNRCTSAPTPCDKSKLLTNEQLRHLLEDDEVYQGLKRHMFMQGKGRRPDLPEVMTVTNKLLLQLLFLKQDLENNGITYTFRELKSLLERLVPRMCHVTESKITYQMTVTLKESLKKRSDRVMEFLTQEYDFLRLPDPLYSLGVTRLHLQNVENYSSPPSNCIPISVAIALENQRQFMSESPIFVRKWLKVLCATCAGMSDAKLKSRMNSIVKTNKDLSKRQKVDELKTFLNGPFFSVDTSIPEIQTSCNQCQKLEKSLKETNCLLRSQETTNEVLDSKMKNMNTELETKNEVIKDLNSEKADLVEKLRDCKREIETLKIHLKCIKNDNKNLLKKASDFDIEKKLCYKRNVESKKDLDMLKIEKELLEKENNELKQEILNLHKTNNDLKEKVKAEQSVKSKYRKEKEMLKSDNEQCMYALNNITDEPEVALKAKGNTYSNGVRQLYMCLIGEANVSSVQATKAVQLVAKHLFRKVFRKEDLPSPRTCLNFMDEAHHIAKQHVADSILKSSHFMYGSDGTSREKKHYMEHHIVLDNGSTLSIGYSEVPDDKSETLLEKSIQLLDELSDIYCKSEDRAEKEKVFAEILSKMKCMMSDRAANMKLFNRKMLDFKRETLGGSDASIEFLYCNAHVLIALADEAEKAVKVQEGLIEDKLGRDKMGCFSSFSTSKETAAFRLMRTSADILGPRGDEKNGCREEWLADCELNDIKSQFTSFRSNRFNNIFENSVAVLYHCNQIVHFLENSCSHSNLKIQSVVYDLKDHRILSIVDGIALFATYLATPYWNLMNSKTPYSQFPKYVQAMTAALTKWSTYDFSVETLSQEEPVFGGEYEMKSQIAGDYFSSENCLKDVTVSVFKQICNNTLKVIRRQLHDFLPEGIYGGEIPEDVRKLLDTCPLTNLTGERMFGDLDYDMVKRRRATSFLRSTINMWKHNKPMEFLDMKKPEEYDWTMAMARKNSKDLREKHLEASKNVRQAIKRKLQENEEKKIQKELNERERQRYLLTEVLSQGGLCETEEDLNRLLSGPSALQNLKVQIRFRKFYMNAKHLRISGNLQTLYTGLCSHLGIEPNETQIVSMQKRRKIRSADKKSKQDDEENEEGGEISDSEEEGDYIE